SPRSRRRSPSRSSRAGRRATTQRRPLPPRAAIPPSLPLPVRARRARWPRGPVGFGTRSTVRADPDGSAPRWARRCPRRSRGERRALRAVDDRVALPGTGLLARIDRLHPEGHAGLEERAHATVDRGADRGRPFRARDDLEQDRIRALLHEAEVAHGGTVL